MPQLSKRAFWDINLSELDYQNHGIFILERVMRYGSLEDWNALKIIYKREDLITLIQNAKDLDVVSISFLCAYFKLEKETLRCCTQNAYPRNYWGI